MPMLQYPINDDGQIPLCILQRIQSAGGLVRDTGAMIADAQQHFPLPEKHLLCNRDGCRPLANVAVEDSADR